MKPINQFFPQDSAKQFIKDYKEGIIPKDAEIVIKKGKVETKKTLSSGSFKRWRVKTNEAINKYKIDVNGYSLKDAIYAHSIDYNKTISARDVYETLAQAYISAKPSEVLATDAVTQDFFEGNDENLHEDSSLFNGSHREEQPKEQEKKDNNIIDEVGNDDLVPPMYQYLDPEQSSNEVTQKHSKDEGRAIYENGKQLNLNDRAEPSALMSPNWNSGDKILVGDSTRFKSSIERQKAFVKYLDEFFPQDNAIQFINDYESGVITENQEIVIRHGIVRKKDSLHPENYK